MLVSELIRLLSQEDPDAEVRAIDTGGNISAGVLEVLNHVPGEVLLVMDESLEPEA